MIGQCRREVLRRRPQRVRPNRSPRFCLIRPGSAPEPILQCAQELSVEKVASASRDQILCAGQYLPNADQSAGREDGRRYEVERPTEWAIEESRAETREVCGYDFWAPMPSHREPDASDSRYGIIASLNIGNSPVVAEGRDTVLTTDQSATPASGKETPKVHKDCHVLNIVAIRRHRVMLRL